MSRTRKLLIVGLVLALGIGLAWPFRNAATQIVPLEPVDAQVLPVRDAVTLQSPAPAAESVVSATPAMEQHVAATMASTGEGAAGGASPAGFDVENHPALSHESHDVPPRSNAFTKLPNEETQAARPAYATGRSAATEAAWPQEVVHVVQNGDTLEKLAQRYMGDAGRALELFDLNRDQLSNPHLLPIGAELRIPVPPERDVD